MAKNPCRPNGISSLTNFSVKPALRFERSTLCRSWRIPPGGAHRRIRRRIVRSDQEELPGAGAASSPIGVIIGTRMLLIVVII